MEPCNYYAYYGNNAFTSGSFISDAFTFDKTPVQGVVFGCSGNSAGDYSGASGVVGLGRGPLSLVSQLALSNFSYFMSPQDSDRGIQIELGDVAVPLATDRSRSTRLQRSIMYTDSYYVGLAGIQVDGQDLAGIPPGTFDLRSDGSGGVALSTTVPVTFLQEAAYRVLKQAFISRIPSRPVDASQLGIGLDLCYMAGVKVPRLTLVFDGVDAALDLSTANYFFKFNDGRRDLQCLTVLPSRGMSVLGSLLQMGTKMIYDLNGEQLTFVMQDATPATSSPAPPSSSQQATAWLATVVPIAVWSLLF
ncbi:hypothetical protein ACP70R_043816 [Stipagrostis hirtigluma subsp. patula]